MNNVKITISENGGNTEYDYSFFEEGFEEWCQNLDAVPDKENLKQYLAECGYRVKKI